MNTTRPLAALVLAVAALTACGTDTVATAPEAPRVQPSMVVPEPAAATVAGVAAPTGRSDARWERDTAEPFGVRSAATAPVQVEAVPAPSVEPAPIVRVPRTVHPSPTTAPHDAPVLTAPAQEQPLVTLPTPVTSDETDPESYPPAPDFVSATPTVERDAREVAPDRAEELPPVVSTVIVERNTRDVNPDRGASVPTPDVTVSDVP